MRILFFLSLLLSCLACKPDQPNRKNKEVLRIPDASSEISNWTCIPGERVGRILNKFTEADIIKAYGKENVGREEINLAEGETTLATTLFPNTDNVLFISWKPGKPFQEIQEILVENEAALWTTNQGIGMGTNLEKLVEINGKEFRFTGFEWDYSGLAKDWQGGKIPENLILFLEPTNPEAVYPDLLGDALFSSDHPKAKQAGLIVRGMIFKF